MFWGWTIGPERPACQGVNLIVTNNLFLGVNGGDDREHPRPRRSPTTRCSASRTRSCRCPDAPNPGLTFNNNVVAGGLCMGSRGMGKRAMGLPSLNQAAPGAVMRANVIEGNAQRTVPYPAGNYPVPAGRLANLLGPAPHYLGRTNRPTACRLARTSPGLRTRIPWLAIP